MLLGQESTLGAAIAASFAGFTFTIILFKSKFRKLYGTPLIFFVFWLFTLYWFIILKNFFKTNPRNCMYVWYFVGYFPYFALLCAQFWASVAAFDFWHHFNNYDKCGEKLNSKSFFKYFVGCHGLALIFPVTSYFIQYSEVSAYFKPQFSDDLCDIYYPLYPFLIWFELPLFCAMIFSIVMLVLSKIRINKSTKYLENLNNDDAQKNLNMKKDKFKAILYICIILGVERILEFADFGIAMDPYLSCAITIYTVLQACLISYILLFAVKQKYYEPTNKSKFQVDEVSTCEV